MAYLFPLATAVSTVNSWAVRRVTNPLQDCCFSRICSSYDEDSESDVWNRAGLFRIHCFRIDRLESDRVRNRFKTSWFRVTRSGSHADLTLSSDRDSMPNMGSCHCNFTIT